jgi:membrane protein
VAKGIAYSLIVGSVPLVFLALSSGGYLLRVAPDLQLSLEVRLDELLPEQLANAVFEQAARLQAVGLHKLGILGLLGLIVVSQGIFSSFEAGLSIIMRNSVRRTIWFSHALYLLLTILAIALFFTASYIHTYINLLYQNTGLPQNVRWLARKTSSMLLIWGALVLIYRVCYRGRINLLALAAVSLGVALLWQLVNAFGSSLIAVSGKRQLVYGVLATVVVFLLWSYSFAFLLLLGGVIIARHSRGIDSRDASA